MAQTPLVTATPYCSVARLFIYHDWQQVSDLVRDGDEPRPTKLALLDSANEPGASLVLMLLAASGELESACLIGKRYKPVDLAALTGSGLGRLEKIVADLGFWALQQRRQPGSADPKNVPGALQALAELDRLRDGERIFSLTESADAGNPSVGQPDPSQRPNAVTGEASRIFGGHGAGACQPRRRC